ncbi:MAG: aldehyde dehydrogenase family protein [Verrucomicrobia bacterium]|nr:aldehyde dehydrogenase family protein [Verrucomicrobiota bacterium]MBI3869942.1 aldehyde dehydrogenase family protein [Verrucomicrobiota bacterium]
MLTYSNWIQGAAAPSPSGKTFETRNPADNREAVASYPLSERGDAENAIASAAAAFPAWAGQTSVARGRVLSKASTLLEARKAQLAELLTREEGKTLAEATGEVQRAVDIFRFFGGLSYTLGGQTIPHDLPQNLLYTRREPLGVVGLITPWNFPIAIPAWKLAPALVCGNTVALKPASQAPAMACELARILTEAGLPPGVFNVVIGEGRAVGGVLATDPRVVAMSFTGSHSVGHGVYQQLAQRMARAQMEMGGKNPTLVLADADLDLAASLVSRAGFGLTGQACTATSRVIVERSVLAVFTEKLIAKAQALKVGPGLQAGVEMGPAVNAQELQGNLDHIEGAVREGAKLLTGGQRITDGDLRHGFFMQPSVMGNVTPEMKIAREEVFGPVVAVIAVDSFDEALRVANDVNVGLSASVVTRDFRKALLYAERIQAGVVKVNQISTGLALQAPFGGVKQSSTDSFKEQGAGAVEFYSKLKTIYLDYSV